MSDLKSGNAAASGDNNEANYDKEPILSGAQSDFAHASQSWDAIGTSPGSAARGEGRASSKKARDVLGEAQDLLQTKFRAASDNVDDFAHNDPWKAIILAAVGGIILGMLISR